MHDFEKFVRIEAVLFHQAAQAGAVTPVVILLQAEGLVVGDLEKVGDVIADAHVDLLPQIEMMRIERVVEIEDPGLDRIKTAMQDVSAFPGDSLLPHLSARTHCGSPNQF